MEASNSQQVGRWLLLIHQIPPRPNYLRVKIGRRLAQVGAVAIKNTVYVLPHTDAAQEDFQWVRREVAAAGGEATLLSAQLVDGLSDAEVERLFRTARDADYAALAADARELGKQLTRRKLSTARRRELEADLLRLERRLEDISKLDFFHATGREATHALLLALRARITPAPVLADAPQRDLRSAYRGRTWVTRSDIHVDRIASAWLIGRFIDEDASFKYVPARGYQPEPTELRFDMFEAEFSHEGDQCTFEVLCSRMHLQAHGLRAVAEIVHDIDIKDSKFGRPETAGIAAMIAGLSLAHSDDDTRLTHGSALFDALLVHFSKQRG